MIAIPHFSEDKVTEIYRIANDFYREFTVQRANTWLQTVYAIVCTNLYSDMYQQKSFIRRIPLFLQQDK